MAGLHGWWRSFFAAGFSYISVYVTLSFVAIWLAPLTGRIALPCTSDGPLQMQSPFYCALNRQYATPELGTVLNDTTSILDSRFSDTTSLVLDANFPFIDGFPLLPHLSHNDGPTGCPPNKLTQRWDLAWLQPF